MLKTYRRKLTTSKETVNFDDLEDEMTAILDLIGDMKDRTHTGLNQRTNGSSSTGNAVDQLAVLMEKTNMEDQRTPSSKKGHGSLRSKT
jgi:hypothetical protein